MSELMATANIAAQYEIAERHRRVYTGFLLIGTIITIDILSSCARHLFIGKVAHYERPL
jgi:hypothetical protein